MTDAEVRTGRRIIVTNAVLSNTGDAAIFEAIADALVSAEVVVSVRDITVFDSNAKVTRRLYPEWDIQQQLTVSPPREPARLRTQLQRLRSTLVRAATQNPTLAQRVLELPLINRSQFARSHAAVRAADVAVSSGGTYLVDHYNFESRVLEFELMRARGLPVVLWTQSLGPFLTTRSSSLIERAEPAIDAAYFRDQRSADSWTSLLGEPRRGGVCADAVFGLAAPAAGQQRATDAPVVAISVRQWGRGVDGDAYNRGAYREMMRFAATRLVDDGWDVRALSTCQGVPSYAYDDSAVAREIFEGLPVAVDEAFHTPLQLLRKLVDVDLVITTRMHLAIMALLAQRPVIAIAYEFKTVELFQSLGLGRFVVRIEDCSPAWISAQIDCALANPAALCLTSDELARLSADARAPVQAVANLLQPA